jgi:hypothetical protein
VPLFPTFSNSKRLVRFGERFSGKLSVNKPDCLEQKSQKKK